MSTFKSALAAGVASLLLSSSAFAAEEAKPAAPAAEKAAAAPAAKKVEKKADKKGEKKAKKKGKQEGEKQGYLPNGSGHYQTTSNQAAEYNRNHGLSK